MTRPKLATTKTRYNLGNLLSGLGRREEARKEYEQARDLLMKLAASPGLPEYQRDLARSQYNLGNQLAWLGKREEARGEYEQARDLLSKLAGTSHIIPEDQLELARAHNNLGNLLIGQGKHNEARGEHEKARALRKKLADTFPAVPQYQIELGGSYGNLGTLARELGKPAGSLQWYDLAIRTLTPVHEKEPRDALAKLFLRNNHWNRAITYDLLKKHAEAARDWDKAFELSTGSEQLSVRVGRANSRAQAGQAAEAVAEIEELTKQPQAGTPGSSKSNANQWYDFACVYAVASGKLGDKKQEYADRAMDLLQRAVKAGYKNAAHLARDTDLGPLRGRDDFKKLLAELSARAQFGEQP